MKQKLFGILLLGVFILGITGCEVKYPDLKDNAVAFSMGEFTDESDNDAKYGTIEYNGRTYMPYGTLKGVIKSQNINKCIGYIIADESSSSIVDENDRDTRVYTLIEDANENYLMIYTRETLMNQPDFFRAVDTKGKKIDTPNYIDSLNYNYWN